MKRWLFFFSNLLFFTFTTMAQAPQAVCYQAVAKDNQGADLIGQDISIRAAVLSNGPNGNAEWEEIHSPTTDQFGLFTINIGEGNSTGGGAQVDFSDIEWGNGDYWLRIEMDAQGGMDFTLMGASKIISVPYALYANDSERANQANYADSANVANTALVAVQAQTSITALDDLDKDPVNEIQSLDLDGDTLQLVDANGVATPGSSVVLQDNNPSNELQQLEWEDCILTISGGNSVDLGAGIFGAPGASSDFPLGILGEHIVLFDQSFTIPDGKNLFLTAAGPEMMLKTQGGDFVHPTTPNMPVLPPSTEVENCFCTGILIDTHSDVEAIVIDLNDPAGFTVPAGKTLFVKSGIPNALPGMLVVNGTEMEFFRPNLTRGSHIVTLPENITITKPALYSELVLTGYLVSN
ncbi:MAG: hypothetical protein AAFZ15_01460 [Bacteroidota bacterium]